MRERITFVHKPGSAVDKDALKVTASTLEGPDLPDAAREDRLTFGLDELPRDARAFLEGSVTELHVRWVSPQPYEALPPFLLARLSPGLHVFFTPRRGAEKKGRSVNAGTEICSWLRRLFGNLRCVSLEETFTALPADRFSHSAAFQYYQPLPSLNHFVAWTRHKLCPAAGEDVAACHARVDTLASAVALDISYDSIAHVLRVTAQWPVAAARRLSVSASGGRGTHRTEVGILTAHADKSVGPHELGVAGLLTVLGDGDGGGKTSPTLFSFPSRHKSAGSQDDRSFSATFKKPTGLHPTLVLELSGTSAAEPPAEAAEQGDCSLHAYLTFPSVIFADRYQLADPLFLASRNLSALRWMSRPVDLEAPDYAAGLPWGSSLLVELEPPLSTPQGQQQQRQSSSWTAEIPLHLRYLAPHTGGHVGVEIPYPAVFWACAAEEGTKFPVNPFDRPHVGYDGLFGPRTLFWHVTPAPPAGAGGGAHTQLTSPLAVPVLDSSDRLAAWVPIGTAAAVLLGFGWVLLTLGIGWWRSRIDGGARTAVPGRETEKKGAAKRETRKTK